MIIPERLTVVARPSKIFTDDAKMIWKSSILNVADVKDQITTVYNGKLLPKERTLQFFFEITTPIADCDISYGRGRSNKTARVIFIDEERKWATIQFIGGRQKTVLVSQCNMKEPYLLPIHWDQYEILHKEQAIVKSVGLENFLSKNYEAKIMNDRFFAFKKGIKVTGNIYEGTGIISTHYAELVVIRFLAAQRNIIEKQIVKITEKIHSNKI